MISLILELLDIDDFYGKSKNIDIAKGKYEIQLTVKKAWKQHKREKAWR